MTDSIKTFLVWLMIVIICVLFGPVQGFGQPVPTKPSIDTVITELYGSLKFNSNKMPDWDRFRSLFIDDAYLIHVADTTYQRMSVETFIEAYQEQIDSGNFISFNEYEIHRVTDTYGHISQVYSTYKEEAETSGGPINSRGINSIQLLKKGNRWYIVSIIWYDENEKNPIPPGYLNEH